MGSQLSVLGRVGLNVLGLKVSFLSGAGAVLTGKDKIYTCFKNPLKFLNLDVLENTQGRLKVCNFRRKCVIESKSNEYE